MIRSANKNKTQERGDRHRKLIQDLHKSLMSNSLCATVNTDKTVIYDANINIHM